MLHKSASCQVYGRHLTSNNSDTSTSTTSSGGSSDTPLQKFNRLLRSSLSRQWSYFTRTKSTLWSRGRSVSDTGLCSIVDNGPMLVYLDVKVPPRRSLQVLGSAPNNIIPVLSLTSAGGSSSHVGLEEASDGSDAEKPRKGQYLRVPTPAFSGPHDMIQAVTINFRKKWTEDESNNNNEKKTPKFEFF